MLRLKGWWTIITRGIGSSNFQEVLTDIFSCVFSFVESNSWRSNSAVIMSFPNDGVENLLFCLTKSGTLTVESSNQSEEKKKKNHMKNRWVLIIGKWWSYLKSWNSDGILMCTSISLKAKERVTYNETWKRQKVTKMVRMKSEEEQEDITDEEISGEL
jgi:hypothetical protein